jgi:hydroxymethylbilane synthase
MSLRVATRRSRLAVAQTEAVCRALAERADGFEYELVAVTSSGDLIKHGSLAERGGKGLFTKELDQALLEGTVDLAVHSLKDVPTELKPGLRIAAVPTRADPRDGLVGRELLGLSTIGPELAVGTSSLRRRAQLLSVYRDRSAPKVVGIRGNVETRAAKVRDGEIDATFLALAGIERSGLSLDGLAIARLDPFDFVPAVGQGALALVTRADDPETTRTLAVLDDPRSRQEVEAERSVARALGASCYLPVGVYARTEGAGVDMVALVADADGKRVIKRRYQDNSQRLESAARRLADQLLEAGAAEIVAEVERTYGPGGPP